MKKILHPKILELQKRVGSTPILYSSKMGQTKQPESIRASNSDSSNGRLLKQYFCIFGVPDDYGTVPVKGCFSKSLKDRGPSSNAAYKITALWQHDQREPLAIPSVLIEDEIGLYGEVSPDEGVPTCDRAVIQVRSGTVNNGSYGFNYVWDKMDYNEELGVILMKECELFEVSFVTIGSQKDTFGIRSAQGEYVDEFLKEETDDFIKSLPRKNQLELRTLISRHISLAKNQPIELLEEAKPIDYNYLINNF